MFRSAADCHELLAGRASSLILRVLLGCSLLLTDRFIQGLTEYVGLEQHLLAIAVYGLCSHLKLGLQSFHNSAFIGQLGHAFILVEQRLELLHWHAELGRTFHHFVVVVLHTILLLLIRHFSLSSALIQCISFVDRPLYHLKEIFWQGRLVLVENCGILFCGRFSF